MKQPLMALPQLGAPNGKRARNPIVGVHGNAAPSLRIGLEIAKAGISVGGAMKRAKILLVDDDRNFLKVLTHSVRLLGFDTVPVSSGREALDRLKREDFDLVVTDLRMPGMDGLELISKTRECDPDLPVIVLTAYGAIDTAVEAVKRGAFDFVTKPFEKEEMRHVISNALKMADLVEENRRLSRFVQKSFKFEGIPGSSKKFREVLELAEQLAAVDTTVLILGESGTGKELLARAVHFNSRRGNKPFVVVNCGAIPEELVESELFGHRKGAFTGAVTDRKGKFETAVREPYSSMRSAS
jgi:two-component system, NtrC family, response regulator